MDEILNNAYDQNDIVNDTKKEMGDCEIPTNINMRANEIDQFVERLTNIQNEFRDLKQADDEFEGTTDSEAEIKELIADIDKKLKGFEQDKRDHNKFQKGKLENYKEKDIYGPNNAAIIAEIREFKARIHDSNERLKDLDELIADLNNKLILQDMTNALKLIGKKSVNLRDRLEHANQELKKIHNCGEEMDGNTTLNEEEEFIDALRDEMPEVFKNIESNFEALDRIDEMLEEVNKSKNIDKMSDLKKEIDDASTKVEQCEGLVNKLENEIIEWNAHKKLCRRDEELQEIEELLESFKDDLARERTSMEGHIQKQNDNLDKGPENAKEIEYLIQGAETFL